MLKKLSNFSNFIFPLIITAFSFALSVNPDESNPDYLKSHPIRSVFFESFQKHILAITVILFIIRLTIYILDWLYNSFLEIKKKELIKFILNQYQSKAFEKNPNDADDYNRVTLFKHKRFYVRIKDSHWFTENKIVDLIKRLIPKQYLVFYLRSGQHSQKTNAIFPIFDDSDKSQGWAARVWARQEAAVITGLPNVVLQSSKANIKKYADTTYSSESVIRHYIQYGRPMPCSIAAIPLEVRGNPWGVLVLDSRSPHGLSQKSIEDYRITVASIQKLLEI